MNRQSFIDALNGGYIEAYSLDLHRRLFTMQVHVLDREKLSVNDVTFHCVSHFAVDDERAQDWDRLELTEIWIDAGPENSKSEEWEVMFTMWDLSHVKLRCTSITVNEEVNRRGFVGEWVVCTFTSQGAPVSRSAETVEPTGRTYLSTADERLSMRLPSPSDYYERVAARDRKW